VPANEVPAFAEYRLPSQSIGGAAITLHLYGATVEISNNADAAVIENAMNTFCRKTRKTVPSAESRCTSSERQYSAGLSLSPRKA